MAWRSSLAYSDSGSTSAAGVANFGHLSTAASYPATRNTRRLAATMEALPSGYRFTIVLQRIPSAVVVLGSSILVTTQELTKFRPYIKYREETTHGSHAQTPARTASALPRLRVGLGCVCCAARRSRPSASALPRLCGAGCSSRRARSRPPLALLALVLGLRSALQRYAAQCRPLSSRLCCPRPRPVGAAARAAALLGASLAPRRCGVALRRRAPPVGAARCPSRRGLRARAPSRCASRCGAAAAGFLAPWVSRLPSSPRFGKGVTGCAPYPALALASRAASAASFPAPLAARSSAAPPRLRPRASAAPCLRSSRPRR